MVVFMIVLVLGFIIGAILGSFINSAVWRVYTKKFSCTDRSRCVTCLEVLSWYDNIPIFSFLRLRGGCGLCQEKIPFDYLLVEIITGFLGVFLVYVNGVHVSGISPLFFRDMVIVLCLVFIFVYDAKYMEILDRVTVLPAILLVIVSLIFGWQSLFVMGIGAIVGGGFFLIQYMVSHGRWVGGGDIRMGVFMGVVLGWPNILFGLLLSYVIGAIFGMWLLVHKKKQLTSSVPFGTFLAIGTMVALYYGDTVVRWYISLLV
jgi:leader peptidase (prepilin peptidase) / N-methyltransferase